MINLFCIRPKGFNIGNDVIYQAMRRYVHQSLGDGVNLIELPATSRYETQAKAGLTSKTVYEMNQYGHGVIVGGGNLLENGELDVDVAALQRLELPLMLFSLSRGRVYNRRGRLVTRTDTMPDATLRALDDQATVALWRDEATAGYLSELGCRHTTVGGCPTIFLDKTELALPSVQHVRGSALISVRQPTLMSIPLNKQAQVAGDIRRIAQGLLSRGYESVRLLCHDHRDIPFAATFSDLDYLYTGDVHHYLGQLKSCALNVTYRLHSFLPCVSYGVPAVKVSYDERALSLVESVGLGSWNINMMTENDVAGAVLDRVDRRDQLTALRSWCGPRWQQLDQTMEQGFHQFAAAVQNYRQEVDNLPLSSGLRVVRPAA